MYCDVGFPLPLPPHPLALRLSPHPHPHPACSCLLSLSRARATRQAHGIGTEWTHAKPRLRARTTHKVVLSERATLLHDAKHFAVASDGKPRRRRKGKGRGGGGGLSEKRKDGVYFYVGSTHTHTQSAHTVSPSTHRVPERCRRGHFVCVCVHVYARTHSFHRVARNGQTST